MRGKAPIYSALKHLGPPTAQIRPFAQRSANFPDPKGKFLRAPKPFLFQVLGSFLHFFFEGLIFES
jgi:hypothetical protein